MAHPRLPNDQLTPNARHQRTYRATKPERGRAGARVRRAVASGRIHKQPCHCGETRVEGHHPNGYGPGHELDVTWLCKRHHEDAHHHKEDDGA